MLSATSTQSGGNMEGKETRYGLAETGVFTVGTTDTSTGAVVSSHDSMTPLGGAVALITSSWARSRRAVSGWE